MALLAVNGMSLGQREKVMIHVGAFPCETGHGVAFGAVFRIIALDMVGRGCRVIVFCMAVIALNPLGFEPELGSGGMTLAAFGGIMRTNQRKTAFLVDLGDILDDPGTGGMTAAAVGAHSLVVHVGMAVETGCTRFGKHQ